MQKQSKYSTALAVMIDFLNNIDISEYAKELQLKDTVVIRVTKKIKDDLNSRIKEDKGTVKKINSLNRCGEGGR